MTHVGALVGVLSAKIHGSSLGLKNAEMNECQYYGEAAFYHDIGKVSVSYEILSKPKACR